MALATSTSTDPVQTIEDLLTGTVSGDYPNGTKPDPIEKHWESEYRTKANRSGTAAYVRSPQVGEQEQISTAGETKDQTERVDVEIWGDDQGTVATIAGDVEAILEDYWNDRTANTQWTRIRTLGQDDRRQEQQLPAHGKFVIAVRVELRRENQIGTGR